MNYVPGSSGAVPAAAPENENIKLLFVHLFSSLLIGSSK